MRIIFAGTPEFARVALAQLHAAGFDVPLVLTQPDRPAGRGMKLQASSVKQFALDHNIPVAQPRSLRLDGKYPEDAAAARAAIESAQADAMVVAAYGLILPQWVLDVMGGPVREATGGEGSERSEGPPRASSAPILDERGSVPPKAHAVKSVGVHKLGCFNIHASLLPRWRGAAPIHRAIEAGDSETGITIMQMDVGLDTGDMLLVEKIAILPTDTTGSLHDRLAALGGRLMVEALALAACGGLTPVRQPEQGVSYAHKIEKHEAAIDWTQSAAVIARRIRAFNPFPAAASPVAGEILKIWEAAVWPGTVPTGARPGEVLAVSEQGVDVAAADGVLRLTRLQKAGGKALDAAQFLRGFALTPGMVFGTAVEAAP
ncbi:MAG: methionyl-tRNA formyltransferase [Polaromonas sp.]|uniref:methionyl-tRNA formyltransferase n=1 Tax=Polaromonas sp. TaxID=1869339 RepID=UPI0027311881|nr:methionyl-tRNA formyltransferase [Polaromonas sp.]MDP2451223.1 methionyl-tRNA formyltransferase [Polaromonas sp.]MDP3246352.1 methionyl-tRNA formyltransferase [Polaromonas sp.]MDP3758070.1 methionyl-tRNA formyltransferase [Polaromonas sp.]